MVAFKKATKSQAKLRAAVYALSGGGKTFSSLAIATGLGGKIAVIDTERGSASKYADRFDFDVLELEDRTIESYIEAIKAAGAAGYGVLIIDSLSHAWQELLEEIDKLANTKHRGNTWAAWRDGTPKQKRLVDAILSYPGHVLATMRAKTEWESSKGDNGKIQPRKVGLAPEQGKGIEYEFDVLMSISAEHVAYVEKDRTGKFQDKTIEKPGVDFGRQLAAWLEQGVVVTPPPAAALKSVPPPDERPAPKPAAPSSEQRLAKALEWAMKHLAKVRIAGAVPADADDDVKKGAQEAVRTARDEDDKGYRALEGVDKRLFCAVRAIADEIEARTLGIDYQRNNDEAEAIAWFTKATSAT